MGRGERRRRTNTPSPRCQCAIKWPHPKGEERQTLGPRWGKGKPEHRRERVPRECFHGISSKVSSLGTLAMD